MPHPIQVHLFGSLRTPSADQRETVLSFDLDAPTPLLNFLPRLDIPADRIQLVMVNHRAAGRDASVHPGDRVSLFPKEYPIFADWNSYRF